MSVEITQTGQVANVNIVVSRGPAGTPGATDYNELTNKPTLGTASPLDVAATGDAASGEVVKGDDTRLTDARTPTAHTHVAADINSNTATAITFLAANGAGGANWRMVSYAELDDLPNSFDPTAHASTHATGGTDALTPADIGAQPAGTYATGTGTATGTNTGDQTITLTGDVTGSGTGSFTATIANDAVTFAKMQEISSTTLIGRHGGGTGNPQEVSVGNGIEFQGSGIRRSALTGDVTAAAGSNTTTIANDAVTNAKLANVPTATIKGRATAGTGDPEDLTLGTGIEFSGLTIRRSALTGDITADAGSNTTAAAANISRVMHSIAVGFVLS